MGQDLGSIGENISIVPVPKLAASLLEVRTFLQSERETFQSLENESYFRLLQLGQNLCFKICLGLSVLPFSTPFPVQLQFPTGVRGLPDGALHPEEDDACTFFEVRVRISSSSQEYLNSKEGLLG